MKKRQIACARVGTGIRNSTLALVESVSHRTSGSRLELDHVNVLAATVLTDFGDYAALRRQINEALEHEGDLDLVLDVSCGIGFAGMMPPSSRVYVVCNGRNAPTIDEGTRQTKIGREVIFSGLKEGASRRSTDGAPFVRLTGMTNDSKERFKAALQRVQEKPPRPDVDGAIDTDLSDDDNLVSTVCLAVWFARNEAPAYEGSDRILADHYARMNLVVV